LEGDAFLGHDPFDDFDEEGLPLFADEEPAPMEEE